MKIQKGFMTAIIVIGLLLGTFTAVQAVPPLPSSFHGTVKVNGANVPEGTAITAWINGTQYAQTQTLMYAGDSVYAIDVPGDDSSTPGVIEGVKAGDTIVFKIDGVTADQTAIWTSGTYPSCDLSAKVITVTADSKSKTYGDADPVFSYTYSPNTPAVAFEGALGRETGENVGAYEITIGTLSAPGYTIIFNTASLTINPKQITVTALARSKIYGQVDPVLSYQTAPSLVTGDSFTGGLARVGGEKVGAYAILQGILAINDGNNGENYNITYVSADLTINRRVITIRADDKMKLVGNPDPPLTYTITTGTLAFEDKITGGLARDAGETIGTYPIRQGTLVIDDGNAGLNYDLSFNNGALTISQLPLTITAQPATKVYGEADPVLTYLASDPSVPLTGALSREVGENVGVYGISIGTLTAGDQYAITFVPANFTITKKAASVTPNAATKIYGAAYPSFSGTLTGFLSADGITATYSRTAGETVAGSPYAISAVLNPTAVLENYDITYNTASFTITKKAASVTPDAATKVYGAPDPSLTGSLSGFLPSDGVTATYSRTAGETVAGSPYTISAVLSPTAVLGNYDISYNTADFTITPKQITVTADEKSKIYGLPDPALSYVVLGLVEDDQLTGSLIRLPGENVGTYQITIGTLTASSNYTIVYVPDFLTISQRAITITADDKVKLIGDPDPALTYTITSGSLAYIDVIAGALVRDAGETIGSYPIRQGTLVIDDGNGGLNYDLSFTDGTLKISQLSLIITAQPAAKVYGEADPMFTYLASDPSVPLTGALSRVMGENVGAYAIIIGTLSAGDEYDIVFVSDDLTITARPITITADDKEKVEGELDPELTFNITDGFLVFEDEIVGELEREPGEVAGLYDILIGSLQIGDGNNGDNYLLTYIKGIFTIHQGINTIYLPLIFK